jgi:hypothetical protein
MKKILLSVTLLLTLASVSNAADKKQTALNNAIENKVSFTANTASAAEMNYAAVLEENTKLRIAAAELSTKLDDLSSKLDYSQMMHATISNLQNVTLLNSVENATTQMDYARMMNATLVNLAVVSANLD